MRGTVVALLLAVGLVIAGGPAVAADQVVEGASPTSDSYALEYDGQCRTIEPLQTSGTVGSFYDYRNHETHPEGVDRMYSSYGTEHLQESDTSLLFLHEGTDGTSIVAVHDRLEGNTTGGIATLEFVGLPPAAEWTVQDDLYDGPTNMARWYDEDGWLGVSSIWAPDRTDGGAINGGMNDAFAVTVHPAFNDDAEFANASEGDLYDPDFHEGGEIDDWEVLSGDAEDPERIPLSSLEEPVTIRTGTCDEPSVSYERTDDGIAATVEGAAPDDAVWLQPTRGTGEDARFDSVTFEGLAGETTVEFESRAVDGLPALPDGNESLSHLTVSGDPVPDDGSTTVFVSVENDRLEELGVGADRVTVYAYDGEEWREAPTEVGESAGGTTTLTAEVDSIESLTVAYEEPDEGGGFPMPGFGLPAAVVALLAALAARAARADGR